MTQFTENQEETHAKKLNLNEIYTGVSHGFDPGVAIYLKDVHCAIIFSHICFWLRHNKRTGQNQIDGRTWFFHTCKDISLELGYLNDRQVRYALEKLVDAGFLRVGRYNTNGFDKTIWYSLENQEDEDKLSKNSFEMTNLSDRFTKQYNKFEKKEENADFSNKDDDFVDRFPRKNSKKEFEVTNLSHRCDNFCNGEGSSAQDTKKEDTPPPPPPPLIQKTEKKPQEKNTEEEEEILFALIKYSLSKGHPFSESDIYHCVKKYSGIATQTAINLFDKEWKKMTQDEKDLIKIPYAVLETRARKEHEFLKAKQKAKEGK